MSTPRQTGGGEGGGRGAVLDAPRAGTGGKRADVTTILMSQPASAAETADQEARVMQGALRFQF